MADKYLLDTLQAAKVDVDKLDKTQNPLAGAISVLLFAGIESAKERHQILTASAAISLEMGVVKADIAALKEDRTKMREDIDSLKRAELKRGTTYKVILGIGAFYFTSMGGVAYAVYWALKNIQFVKP